MAHNVRNIDINNVLTLYKEHGIKPVINLIINTEMLIYEENSVLENIITNISKGNIKDAEELIKNKLNL